MQSPISVWRKDPRFLTDYYTPGMYLGEPDEVIQPETLVKPGSKSPPIPRLKGRPPRKEVITKAQYERHVAEGLSRAAIASAYDISYGTLSKRLKEWGI